MSLTQSTGADSFSAGAYGHTIVGKLLAIRSADTVHVRVLEYTVVLLVAVTWDHV